MPFLLANPFSTPKNGKNCTGTSSETTQLNIRAVIRGSRQRRTDVDNIGECQQVPVVVSGCQQPPRPRSLMAANNGFANTWRKTGVEWQAMPLLQMRYPKNTPVWRLMAVLQSGSCSERLPVAACDGFARGKST